MVLFFVVGLCNCATTAHQVVYCLFLYLAQSTSAVARSLVDPGFNGIGSDCLILCSHDESFSQFQVISQSVFPSVSLRYWPCSALFCHLSWRFLISFLLYSFVVSSTVSSLSVMTSLSALSVLLLMYSLRFLISSYTVCLICRSPLPQFFPEGIVYQCYSVGVEYDGQS